MTLKIHGAELEKFSPGNDLCAAWSVFHDKDKSHWEQSTSQDNPKNKTQYLHLRQLFSSLPSIQSSVPSHFRD